jgi:hypothetical protein
VLKKSPFRPALGSRAAPPATAWLLALGAALATPPAFGAGPDTAQALFDRGLQALKAARYDEACPALEQSYKLDPLPGALFTLAECEAKRGRLTVAVARYDEYLRLYATLPPDKQVKQAEREKIARAQRANLEPRIAELTLALPPDAPRETRVTLDGTTLSASNLGVPAFVDPGEHVVTVQIPGGPSREQRILLAPGEKKGIALEARSASALAVLPAGSAAQPRVEPPSLAPVWIAFAVGGAGLVTGAVTGILSLNKVNELKNQCPRKDCPTDTALVPVKSSAVLLGNISTAGFVVGGAGLALGGVLLGVLWPRAKAAEQQGRVNVDVGPGSVDVRGRF